MQCAQFILFIIFGRMTSSHRAEISDSQGRIYNVDQRLQIGFIITFCITCYEIRWPEQSKYCHVKFSNKGFRWCRIAQGQMLWAKKKLMERQNSLEESTCRVELIIFEKCIININSSTTIQHVTLLLSDIYYLWDF